MKPEPLVPERRPTSSAYYFDEAETMMKQARNFAKKKKKKKTQNGSISLSKADNCQQEFDPNLRGTYTSVVISELVRLD